MMGRKKEDRWGMRESVRGWPEDLCAERIMEGLLWWEQFVYVALVCPKWF